MRLGGASHDAQEAYRTMAEIKTRGRWSADSSVRRYQKPAQLTSQINKLEPAVVRRLTFAADNLEHFFRKY